VVVATQQVLPFPASPMAPACPSPPLPQGAADQHRLDDEGSQELQLGLMGMGIAALGVQLAHGGAAAGAACC
jgi:hypothetical protein